MHDRECSLTVLPNDGLGADRGSAAMRLEEAQVLVDGDDCEGPNVDASSAERIPRAAERLANLVIDAISEKMEEEPRTAKDRP